MDTLAMTRSKREDCPEGAPEESPAALFATLESPLLRYAMNLVRQWETAQDIVQEAFLRLQKKAGEVRQPKPWLYRTVHNLAMTHRRRSAVRGEDSPEVGDGGGDVRPDEAVLSPDAELERAESVRLARTCLHRLPERERQLLEMKFTGQLSYREMADKLDLKTGHVGYLLHHALKQLRDELAREGWPGEDRHGS